MKGRNFRALQSFKLICMTEKEYFQVSFIVAKMLCWFEIMKVKKSKSMDFFSSVGFNQLHSLIGTVNKVPTLKFDDF